MKKNNPDFVIDGDTMRATMAKALAIFKPAPRAPDTPQLEIKAPQARAVRQRNNGAMIVVENGATLNITINIKG